jgi:predicted RNase H-like HicB family nuclease
VHSRLPGWFLAAPDIDRHIPLASIIPRFHIGGEGAFMLRIEIEQEDDGRWIGEVTALPGVLAYGATEAEARSKAAALALRVIADRIEHGEPVPEEARELFTLT